MQHSVCIHLVWLNRCSLEKTGLKLRGWSFSTVFTRTVELLLPKLFNSSIKMLVLTNWKRNETVLKSTEKTNPNLKINRTRDKVSSVAGKRTLELRVWGLTLLTAQSRRWNKTTRTPPQRPAGGLGQRSGLRRRGPGPLALLLSLVLTSGLSPSCAGPSGHTEFPPSPPCYPPDSPNVTILRLFLFTHFLPRGATSNTTTSPADS